MQPTLFLILSWAALIPSFFLNLKEKGLTNKRKIKMLDMKKAISKSFCRILNDRLIQHQNCVHFITSYFCWVPHKQLYQTGIMFCRLIKITRHESTGTSPGIWTLEIGLWFMDFGLLLWTKDDSGLPTRPLNITKTLKTFLR